MTELKDMPEVIWAQRRPKTNDKQPYPYGSWNEEKDCFGITIKYIRSDLAERDGWMMVPIEPTTVMDNEGVIALSKSAYGAQQSDVRACYKAMLASAPQAEEECDDA